MVECEGSCQVSRIRARKKVGMPPCPRCVDRMNVIKYGKHNSPTVGELQQYFCKPCNYEFMLFPKLPQREDVEPCPECHRKDGVSKRASSSLQVTI
jgi:transposase-like protein